MKSLLSDVLPVDAIRLNMEAEDRLQVVEDLVDMLIESGQAPPSQRDTVLLNVGKRERSQPTGMGSGVAIPHCACPGAKTLMAALGVAPAGIDFRAADKTPAQVILLLVIPQLRFPRHLRFMADSFRVLQKDTVRKEILVADTAQAVLDAIIHAEQGTA